MADWVLRLSTILGSLCGLAWIALAMNSHWTQVRGDAPLSGRTAERLRWFGGTSLLVSLMISLSVDHSSIAVLVWLMTLSAAALSVALILAYRPRWLNCFLLFVPYRK